MNRHEQLLHTILRGRSDANLRFSVLRAQLGYAGFGERIRVRHRLFDKEKVVDILNLQGRSPIVAKVDGQGLVEINFIRGVLEPLALADAVPNHTPETLAECESLHQRERGCAHLWEKMELNRKFHTSPLAPSELARTQSIITDQYVGLARITHYLVMKKADLIDAHYDEHQIILTGIKRGHTKRAAQLLGAHIERATGRARTLFSGAENKARTF